MKRKMQRLARGAMCEIGLVGAARADWPRSAASAVMPKPAQLRSSMSGLENVSLVDIEHLVGGEEDLGVLFPPRQLGVGGLVEEGDGEVGLGGGGVAAEDQVVRPRDPR